MENKEDRRASAEIAIELWRESGLSQGAFCRREGIARTTFQHWRKRYDPTYEKSNQKPIRVKKSKEQFISIALEEPSSISSSSDHIEIIYQNQVRIKCSASLPPSTLQTLIGLQ